MGMLAGRISGLRSPFSHKLWMTAAIGRRTPRVRWNCSVRPIVEAVNLGWWVGRFQAFFVFGSWHSGELLMLGRRS
jgi:hypothetical protein